MTVSLISLFFSVTVHANNQIQNECLLNIEQRIENDAIDLNQCGLRDSDMPEILSVLANHTQIKKVYLYRNNIGAQGASTLAKQNN